LIRYGIREGLQSGRITHQLLGVRVDSDVNRHHRIGYLTTGPHDVSGSAGDIDIMAVRGQRLASGNFDLQTVSADRQIQAEGGLAGM